MQKLKIKLINKIKKMKMKKLESQMREFIIPFTSGELFICPYCQYTSSKNPKGSAKVFDGNTFKCFSCGKWRGI